MTINADTTIASLIKHHPQALDTIVSISQKFVKLRNPVLRKLMAGRTSIATASKLGGCKVEDFFNRLQPLGFIIDATDKTVKDHEKKSVPAFLKNLRQGEVVELDVRPVLETGKDPLKIILEKVKALEKGSVLKIINSFEPAPLMILLAKQGFHAYSENISADLVHTYFYKDDGRVYLPGASSTGYRADWDTVLARFKENLEIVDVRELEMPLPMHTILQGLQELPTGKALFVYHKRVPVFLLPELEEQKFSYRIREVNDAEVHLLIYKD